MHINVLKILITVLSITYLTKLGIIKKVKIVFQSQTNITDSPSSQIVRKLKSACMFLFAQIVKIKYFSFQPWGPLHNEIL